MTLRRAALTLLSAFLLTVAAAAPAGAQATRTWVSGVGDDVNPCSRTAPCKTMAGAIGKTAPGGEINALDPGPYGALTITKPLTVDLSAAGTAGVLHTGLSGITVNAGATDDVVLRGLDIMGGGALAAACRYQGVNGIHVRNARSVRIEDSTIAQNANAGILLAPEGTDPTVIVNRVDVSNNCANGIKAAPAAGRTVGVMVRDTTISNSGTAVSVGARGHAWLTGSTIFGNAVGLQAIDGGILETYGDNRVVGNIVDGAATVAHTDVGPQGPAGESGPQGPAGEAATKLMLALPAGRVTARTGKRVALRYVTTAPARATLEVRRRGKRVATVRAKATAGRNTIRWSGKIRRKSARPGRYKLMLRAAGADGQSDSATAALRLTR